MNRSFLAVCAVILAASAASAECTGVVRAPTAAERAYFQRFPALRAALPKTPEPGWVFTTGGDVFSPAYKYVPDQVCDGGAGGEVPLDIWISYKRPMTQAEMHMEVRAMQAPVAPPAGQKALLARQQALIQKITDAAQHHDNAALARLGKENEQVSDQITRMENISSNAARARTAPYERDRKASLRLRTDDPLQMTCYGEPTRLPIAGVTAYACSQGIDYNADGDVRNVAAASVLLGVGRFQVELRPWRRLDVKGAAHDDHYVVLTPQLDAARMLTEQNATLVINSDNLQRVKALLARVDIARLRRFVAP